MKIILIILALIGVIAGATIILSGDESAPLVQTEDAGALPYQAIESDIAVGALLVDVRTAQEYQESHIEGATLFPLDVIRSEEFPTEAKDKKLYLYCRSGNRSAEAKLLLEKAGYTNVIDLGGLQDVVSIGGTEVR